MNDPYHGGMHLPGHLHVRSDLPRRKTARVFRRHLPSHRRRRAGAGLERERFNRNLPGRAFASRRSSSTRAAGSNATLEKLIKINVRVPERVWGDLQAQYAASQVGAKGLGRLFERYGADEVEQYMAELMDYAERMTREEIRRWPKGTYTFVDHIDSDGFTDDPIPIKVAITVEEDSLVVDYTGSSPQVKAALNSTKSYTHSNTYLSVRCVLSRDIPNNVGVFRCIKVKVPDASVLNPVLPGACAARALTGYRIFDTMLGALAQIVPDRVPAAGEGGNSVVCISGLRRNRKPFIIVDMICGAWGGRPDKDGVEAITNPVAEPVEHAGGGDGGRAPRPGRGIRIRSGQLRRRPMARRGRNQAFLPHSRRRGAAAAADRPGQVSALRSQGRRSRAASRAISSPWATRRRRCPAR